MRARTGPAGRSPRPRRRRPDPAATRVRRAAHRRAGGAARTGSRSRWSTASRSGPVAVLAARRAVYRGAGRVRGTELVRERPVRAVGDGVTVLSSNPRNALDLTGGRGEDSVVDAVAIGCTP